MANSFGTDILIQAPDAKAAAAFYVRELGFTVTDEAPHLISLHGEHINLFIEQGPTLGPVLEVFVRDVAASKAGLVRSGCTTIKDEPELPRCYVQARARGHRLAAYRQCCAGQGWCGVLAGGIGSRQCHTAASV